MKRMTSILYMMFAALLMIIVTGCSSTGYSGGTSYHHRNSWDYDNHYRSGVNKNYNRSAAANRSSGAARAGAAARSGGGGRAGGGGRR